MLYLSLLNIYLIGEIYKALVNRAYNHAKVTIVTNIYHNHVGHFTNVGSK